MIRLASLAALLICAGCAQPGPESAPLPRRLHTLHADRIWQLDSGGNGRFDASGLLLRDDGRLLTVNDRNSDLFLIELGDPPSARLIETTLFPPDKVAAAAPIPKPRFDCEGIASDNAGRLYICEEADRAIYRSDPRTGEVERFWIDFTSVEGFLSKNINASWEGIAIGDGRLYLANERTRPVIVAVDLKTREVVDHFTIYPSGFALGGPHYSGLSWFDGHLYVLDRNHRTVVQVDPQTHRIVTEFDFSEMEQEEDVDYKTDYPTGTMEGIAADAGFIWLITDNNGRPRRNHPNDVRPTLFRCPRPDR